MSNRTQDPDNGKREREAWMRTREGSGVESDTPAPAMYCPDCELWVIHQPIAADEAHCPCRSAFCDCPCHLRAYTCPTCNGSGWEKRHEGNDWPCRTCGGFGRVGEF